MYKRFIKRVLDIMMAVMGLPLLLLAFVMIGPMIYLEDRGLSSTMLLV